MRAWRVAADDGREYRVFPWRNVGGQRRRTHLHFHSSAVQRQLNGRFFGPGYIAGITHGHVNRCFLIEWQTLFQGNFVNGRTIHWRRRGGRQIVGRQVRVVVADEFADDRPLKRRDGGKSDLTDAHLFCFG